MSFLEVLSIVLGAAGLFASILGAFLTVAARHNGEATRTLVREMTAGTQEATRTLVREMTAETQAATRDLIRSMEERMTTILERMDQRADDRHREVIDAIRALRA